MKRQNILGAVMIINDLSEEYATREQINILQKLAFLGEITSIFAHEVRNPINNISTGMDLISLTLPENDQNQDTIARIRQDCDRMDELMNSILTYSRSEQYEMEDVRLNLLLERLITRMKPRLAGFQIETNVQIAQDCPAVKGNPRALEQVLINLINNAGQAMKDNGGKLAVKLKTVSHNSQTSVEVSVADTGPGIPEDLQEKIFEPFFTTERGGTGLGLAISKRIIDSHYGEIELESFPGGSVFTIILPAAENNGKVINTNPIR
jgi:signal transduction histidine kinase